MRAAKTLYDYLDGQRYLVGETCTVGIRFTTHADEKLDCIPEDMGRVVEYWSEKREDRFAPSWDEFSLEDLDTKIIPRCNVVDVLAGGTDFVYRFWGTARVGLQNQDMTGKHAYDLYPPEFAETVIDEYQTILHARKPVWFEKTAIVDKGREFQYHFLRMPLSGDGTTIDKIFAITPDRRSPSEFASMIDIGLIPKPKTY